MIERQREPVVIPRWLLTAKYLAFLAVGLAVLNTEPATFERVYDTSLTAIWAILLIIASLVSFAGSLRAKWERSLERWGVTAIWVLMAIYAFAPISLLLAGDPDRLAYSSIALLVSLLPFARAVQLGSRRNA